MFYAKTVLPGGLRVVTEEIPHVRSASVGVWVGAGSAWETEQNQGISHFIEHLLFKGTATRTAKEIAQEIDGRGGSLNAFTSREHTCYYAKVLDEHFPIAVDVLADMVQHSLFDAQEIEKEKGVVIEEIKMYDDLPDDQVHDLFSQAVWAGHALGRPIIGTVPVIQGLDRDDILGYFQSHYVPEHMVVAVAGNVSHDQAVEVVGRAFAHLGGQRSATPPTAPRPPLTSRAVVRPKETEQVHVVVGTTGLHLDHDDTYAMHLISTVLGGGPNSRLFQEIREERGLAYAVFSYHQAFAAAGQFGVYAGTAPGSLTEVLHLIEAQLARIGSEGLPEAEIAQTKEQVKGQVMLSLESTSGRMTRLGRGEISLGRVLSPDEIIERIDAVTPAQIAALGRRLFVEAPRILAAVGPVDATEPWTTLGYCEVKVESDNASRSKQQETEG